MIKYFPSGYTPTSKQEAVFDLVNDKFFSDKKFLIIQAPTTIKIGLQSWR